MRTRSLDWNCRSGGKLAATPDEKSCSQEILATRIKARTLQGFAAAAMCLMLLAGCNGRPTYNIAVYDFDSDCDGQVVTRFQHDPEPEARTLTFEPDFAAAAQAAGLKLIDDGRDIRVVNKSEIECSFHEGDDEGRCRHLPTNVPVDCRATIHLYCYRYPSKGPGYDLPIAKKGQDFFPPKRQ